MRKTKHLFIEVYVHHLIEKSNCLSRRGSRVRVILARVYNAFFCGSLPFELE